MTRAQALAELAKIERISSQADGRAAAMELAEASDDSFVRVTALADALTRSRRLGEQQRVIVTAAELLPLLGELFAPQTGAERSALERILSALWAAVYACLDVPEVPFTAIDPLLDAYARVLTLLDLKDYSARRLRAQRHFVAGEAEELAALIESLMPHVNYTNGIRQSLGCPSCVLSAVAWHLGPAADLGLLEAMLEPIFSRRFNYPNEDPALLRQLRDSGQRCDSVFSAHMHFARALMAQGRTRDAAAHIAEARRYKDDSPCYLLPAIFRLEASMATAGAEALRAEIRRLRPRVEAHEDAQEAMLGCLRVAQALALVGDDPDDQAHLWAVAEHHARRLDARLARPRHLAEVAHERAHTPPPFVADSPILAADSPA
ncbi:MAG: hypothetical protein R3A79_24785 [Nannocystaceae bacterium]